MNKKKEKLDQELEQWLSDFHKKKGADETEKERNASLKKDGKRQEKKSKVSRDKGEKRSRGGKTHPRAQGKNTQKARKSRRLETRQQDHPLSAIQKQNVSSNAKTICSAAARCGGCQLLHLSYEEQLQKKREWVSGLLKGVCPVHTITGMDQPWHYRNKVHAVFDHDQKGNPISGVYEAGSHQVVLVESCRIEDEKADQIIGTIRSMLKSFKIRTYDEDTGYGLLRHVLIRIGKFSGQIMVVLVTASPIFPSKNHFVKALREKHPEITTIIQNINDKNTSMVLGERESILYGKGYIEDHLLGYTFRISPKSFYQINPIQTEKLYQKAVELAGLTGKETVLDAYCGTGTIGIIAASSAKEVIGVELNPDAVRDAVKNVRGNGVKNMEIYCNDASVFLSEMTDRNTPVDVVFMDPPRSGSTEIFMNAVGKMKPSRVVYISCGPESLARDLNYFKKLGYRAEGAWLYDLFPQTVHVETIVLLSKGKADSKKIRVEFSLGDMDMSEFQDGATYTD